MLYYQNLRRMTMLYIPESPSESLPYPSAWCGEHDVISIAMSIFMPHLARPKIYYIIG